MPRSLPLFVLLLLPLSPLLAQTAIHRCVGANGNPVFTDRVCADVQATPTRPAASVPAGVSGSMAVASEPPPILCATNLAELKQGVVDAFATRDANRLAGLMLWGGYGQRAVVADIRSLRTLMQRPLLDLGPPAASAEPAASTAAGSIDQLDQPPGASFNDQTAATATPVAPTGEPTLVMRTAADDGTGIPHETRFALVRRSGCLWLRQQ